MDSVLKSSSGGHSKMSPNLNARGLGLGETPLRRWGGYRGSVIVSVGHRHRRRNAKLSIAVHRLVFDSLLWIRFVFASASLWNQKVFDEVEYLSFGVQVLAGSPCPLFTTCPYYYRNLPQCRMREARAERALRAHGKVAAPRPCWPSRA